MKVLMGMPAAGGIGIGPAFVVPAREARTEGTEPLGAAPADEARRLENAAAAARAELRVLERRVTDAVGVENAWVFEAQRLMLDDPELITTAEREILEGGRSADEAVSIAADAAAATLAAAPDEYMQARAADVRDVAARVRAILQGRRAPLAHLQQPSVVVAHELYPSDAASVDRRRVLALVMETGTATAHAAILARALGIPAVVGVEGAIAALHAGDSVIVDGDHGDVLVCPDSDVLAEWTARQHAWVERQSALAQLHALPAATIDGHRLEVGANIGSPDDAPDALSYGAESVGLLRTEFLFLDRHLPPSEDEQYSVYRRTVEALGGRPVIIRSVDIGGDKPVAWLGEVDEANPFLGLRGLRLSLAHRDVFVSQVRAVLRASARGPVSLMLPMVADVGEIRAARAIIEEARAELLAHGTSVGQVRIGVMIEVPSAALLADRVLAEVDFVSIGTNDLTQCTLAADRTNPGVSAIADALHPAVLQLIAAVTRAARTRGKWVGVCGEVAGDPLAVPLLIGLGVDELSMTASRIPEVKQAVRGISYADAVGLARRALSCGTAGEVRQLLFGVTTHAAVAP